MCGIVGVWDRRHSLPDDELSEIVRRMACSLRHRGPDDEGYWADHACGIALGHRRLSVLDLSAQGHQPMSSADGRFQIIFNGEIYNFRSLRAELEMHGSRFRGHSDTEVLLSAIDAWGLEKTLHKCVGMFAFALWDTAEKTLSLARDRLGEKPLYYGWIDDTLLFASELKAFPMHPRWKGRVDQDALTSLMRRGHIASPHCIFQNVSKVPPGAILHCRMRDDKNSISPSFYWNLEQVALSGAASPFRGTKTEALDQLDDMLRDAVQGQVFADVPVGAFLSGGVDSSLIASLMVSQSDQAVHTYTVGFHDEDLDEARHAKAIAEHLGTAHTELYVTPEEAIAIIPSLPELYDEPFADASQIPTHLVARLARDNVTVALTGDGADELFAGYRRYHKGFKFWRHIHALPLPLRSIVAAIPQKLVPRRLDMIHKLMEAFVAESIENMYATQVSYWRDPQSLVLNSREPAGCRAHDPAWHDLHPIRKMMFIDTMGYLPDDVLVKVDRACMGCSLEARVPFLDHRIVEFSHRLPISYNCGRDGGKGMLRQLLSRYVPEHLTRRRKQGFVIPLRAWLRGPLRDWAEDLLDERRLRQEGYLNPEIVRRTWQQHLVGDRDWQVRLWHVLMFQAWLERWNRT